MRIPSLHRNASPDAARQYPVLMARALICQFELVDPASIPPCQRGGCQRVAVYARVWLSPVEPGRYALSNLRHGVYYCETHAEEARATSGIPLIQTEQMLDGYERQMIEARRADRPPSTSSPAPPAAGKTRILVAAHEKGSILRLADGSLEVLAGDGQYYPVCCMRQAQVATTTPERVMDAGHSRTCPNHPSRRR